MSNFFLFLIVCCYLMIAALSCEIPSQPRTRIFDNFDNYRSNKVPFKPSREGWQGSKVEFKSSTIGTLPKNIFVTYDSESVISLKLSGKQIKEIEDGAFLSLLCLQELSLDNNSITVLSKNIFPNSLRQLDVSHNQIEILHNFTFVNLLRLRRLNLGHNWIRNVEVSTFINLTLLEYLNLESNKIKIVPDNLFRPLVGLVTLILSWNGFGTLRGDKWGSLPNLKNLELAGVDLKHFEPSHFPFVNLESVNLSSNSLTILDVVEVKRHYPNLELVDLGNNVWICDDLVGIIRDLNQSSIKLPPGDLSRVGINGVACEDTLTPLTPSEGTTATSTGATKTGTVCINSDELERYVQEKIEQSREDLGSTIASLRTLAILTFALLWIFIIAEVTYRSYIGGCFCYRRRRNEHDQEDNDVDFSLLHMKES